MSTTTLMSDAQRVRQEMAANRSAALAAESTPYVEDQTEQVVGEAVTFEPAPPTEGGPAQKEQPRVNGKFAKETPETTEPVAATPEPVPAQDATPAPKMVKVKIDDVETEVSQEDIDKAGGTPNLYQLEHAAKKRLATLNDIVKQAKATVQPVQQTQQQPQQDPRLAYLPVAQRLRNGSDEEIADILMRLDRPVTNPVENAQLAALVLEFKSGAQSFVRDLGDLWQSQDIQTIAWARETKFKQDLQQGKATTDIDGFYKGLSTELKTKYGKPATPVNVQERVERKAQLAEPPVASGRVPAPPAEKTKTVKDSVNMQRKARGLPAFD